MRLSEWRAAAPNRDAASPKVAALVDPVIGALGAEPDPHGWVVWGEESGVRYSILVPIDAGLIVCFVRVTVPGEGPRVSATLVRWNRVEIGELAIETSSGHRLLSFQVEGYVLQGADDVADRIAAFALEIFAAIDGRQRPEPASSARKARGSTSGKGSPATAPSSRTAARGRATGSNR